MPACPRARQPHERQRRCLRHQCLFQINFQEGNGHYREADFLTTALQCIPFGAAAAQFRKRRPFPGRNSLHPSAEVAHVGRKDWMRKRGSPPVECHSLFGRHPGRVRTRSTQSRMGVKPWMERTRKELFIDRLWATARAASSLKRVSSARVQAIS